MTDHQHEDGAQHEGTARDGETAVDGDSGEAVESAPCRALSGVEPTAVSAFVAALAAARKTLEGIPQRLEAARVHDEAFGKLIDAHKVRDAYHQRLPATEENVGEACTVIDHLTGEFTLAGVGPEEPEPAAVPAPRDAVVS